MEILVFDHGYEKSQGQGYVKFKLDKINYGPTTPIHNVFVNYKEIRPFACLIF